MLLKALLTAFKALGTEKMIVYNFHCAPSNTYYRRLGCEVTGTELQTGDEIQTDIFTGDIGVLLSNIKSMLNAPALDFT